MDNKILEKIKKMVELLKSEEKLGNIEAAANMAALVQTLLLKHNLTLDDVQVSEYNDYVVLVYNPDAELRKDHRVPWQEELAFVVAKAHMCKAMVIPGGNMQGFTGRRQDVEVAIYMYSVLLNAAVTMCHTAFEATINQMYSFHGYPRSSGLLDNRMMGFERSFYVGFVVAITDKYRQTEEYVKAATATTEEGCTALIRLEGQMIKVEQFIRDTYPEVGMADSILETPNDRSGFFHGYQAGKNTQVRNAIIASMEKPDADY